MRLRLINRIVLGAIPILIGLPSGTVDAQIPESPILWQYDTGG